MGLGDGTFDETVRYIPTKGDNFSIIVADLDGDGKPDIVTANYSARSITVALGEGDGNFKPPIVLGSWPWGMAAADFDGDGKPDLAVTNYLANTVNILRGGIEPNGAFIVGENPGGIYSADFNGDGIPDLIVDLAGDGGLLNSASVLLGTGGGGFRAGATAEGHFAVAADFDRDGIPDLAVTTFIDQPNGVLIYSVSILSGKGSGVFERIGSIDGISNLRGLTAGDFNRDGIPDLALVTTDTPAGGTGTVLIYLGKGGGVFQAAGRYGTGQDSTSILVSDFNHDGLPDLAVAGRNSASIFLGAADGTFHPAPEVAIGTQPFCNCLLTSGDFDGDGNTDLAVAETPTDSSGLPARSIIWIHHGAGDGKFSSPVRVYTGPANSEVKSLLAADFDKDGRTDLAAIVYNYAAGQGTVSILSSRTAP